MIGSSTKKLAAPKHRTQRRSRREQHDNDTTVGGQMTKWNSCPRSLYYKELALRPRRAPHMHIYQAIGTGIVATISLVALLILRPQVQSLSIVHTVIDAIAGSAGLSAGVWYFLASHSIEAIVVDWIEPLAKMVYRICLFWLKLTFQIIQTVWLCLANNLDAIWTPVLSLIMGDQSPLHTLLYGVLGGIKPTIVATTPSPSPVTTTASVGATARSTTLTQPQYRNRHDNNETIIPEERDDNFTFTSMSTSSSLARLDEDHPAATTSSTPPSTTLSITTITTNKTNKKLRDRLQKLHEANRSRTSSKSSLRYYGASSSYQNPPAHDQD